MSGAEASRKCGGSYGCRSTTNASRTWRQKGAARPRVVGCSGGGCRRPPASEPEEAAPPTRTRLGSGWRDCTIGATLGARVIFCSALDGGSAACQSRALVSLSQEANVEGPAAVL